MSKVYKAAANDVEAGRIAPVYLITGDEMWSKGKFIKLLKARVVDPSMADFNMEVLTAGSIRGTAVADRAQALPMMADRRLIIIEDCDAWKADDHNAIAKYFGDINDQTCLVLVFLKPDSRRKIFKSKQAGIKRLDFLKPKRWEWNDYIGDLARDMGLRLKPDAIGMVAEMVGDDLAKVHQDLEKLSLFKLDSNEITAGDVELLMGRTRQVTRWELNDFIGKRDLPGTMIKLHDIFAGGEEPIGLLSTVNMFLRQLFVTKALITRGVRDKSGVGRALGLPPRIAQGLIDQQKNYSSYELRRAFKLMAESDFQLKSAAMKKTLILDRLLTQILMPGPYSPPAARRLMTGR